MKKLLTVLVLLILAATSFGSSVLVYDGGGSAGIQAAMTELGIAFDLRNAAAPVTAGDLTSHGLLVVGWNEGGDMSGLSGSVLGAGITGNMLLTGHDADWHVVHGWDSGSGGDAVDAAATAFLSQAIAFAEGGGGTGLVALGDITTGFSYLPTSWGISATGGLIRDTVTSFTAAGLASGVYAGLTPADMSGWGNSYHASFNSYAGFDAFELDGSIAGAPPYVVTIGRGAPVVPEPASIMSLFAGLALHQGCAANGVQATARPC
jgi:hypothetical protein